MRKSYNFLHKDARKNSLKGSETDGELPDAALLVHHSSKGVQSQVQESPQSMSPELKEKLRNKFRGCLVGALVGDCIGTLFECDYTVSCAILGDLYVSLTNLSDDEKLMDLHGIDRNLEKKVAQEILERKRASVIVIPLPKSVKVEPASQPTPPKRHSSFEKRRGSFSRPIEKYSDDTVMARSVARSLIRKNGVDVKDMAMQLTEDYYLNLTRKYGTFSREIFTQLRNAGYGDPLGPAKKVSGSLGALGNQGATLVAPIALFAWNNDQHTLMDMAIKTTKIINYNKSAIVGATAQAVAINTALNWDLRGEGSGNSNTLSRGMRLRNRLSPSPKAKRKFHNQENICLEQTNKAPCFNYKEFCQHILDACGYADSNAISILENIRSFVTSSHRDGVDSNAEGYTAKIQSILEFLEKEEIPSRGEVVEKLGNGVKALDSVPTALYSFLMTASSMKFSELPVNITSPVLRTIFYSISLGGDSDTIASLSGAIAGAYWGYDSIPTEILRVCEGANETLILADELFNHCFNKL